MQENIYQHIPFKELDKELRRTIDNGVIYFNEEIYPIIEVLGKASLLGLGLFYIYNTVI